MSSKEYAVSCIMKARFMCFRCFDGVSKLTRRAPVPEVAGGFNSMLRTILLPERTAHRVWYILPASFNLSGSFKERFVQKTKKDGQTSSK